MLILKLKILNTFGPLSQSVFLIFISETAMSPVYPLKTTVSGLLNIGFFSSFYFVFDKAGIIH